MNDKYFKWGVFVIVFACIVYGAYVWYWWDASMESKGQLGDSFGAVTSLFTVLTFFYFVHTVDLQRQQLLVQKDDFKLQLDEQKLTREELIKQSKAQQKSEEALREQIEKQVLSTLLNSYTSQFSTLINAECATFAVSNNIYSRSELTMELRSLKAKIKKLETHLEYHSRNN